MANESLVEVFRCKEPMLAQTVVEEILEPAGIEAFVHNRTSHAFFAPASMPGAYFVAVEQADVARAKAALREAVAGGVIPAEGEIAPDPA